uniref:HTH cro/C1-type domain-containing protein n=1 Tax=Acidobacterium capsulatum TaxID=33075 RepID=A0A7V4XR47_9BACT
MIHFGEELRQERERRGISLQMIVETTKVASRHLQSLEEDHFDLLPGGVFNKGIVRDYARAVGLDETTWVDRFMQAYRESGQMKDDDVHWVEFAENVGRNRPHKDRNSLFRLRWAGVAMLVAMLAVSGWFVWQYVNNRASSSASQPAAAASTSQTTQAFNGGS